MFASKYKIFTASLSLAVAFSVSCGGSPSSTPPTPQVSVSLNQPAVNLAVGTSTQFTATVQNTTNTAVTWSVDQVSGGNATVGTISSAGEYKAPSQPGSHTVTATSVADTTKSANAAVAVGLVSVADAVGTLTPAATDQFTATVHGFSNTAVTWSVDGIASGNPTVGTINAAGLYTAPALAGTHTITATSVAVAKASASATITVAGVLSLSPATVDVEATKTQQFTATTSGLTNPTITWSVDQIAGGNSTVGTITSSGLYTAPTTAGNHTITATANDSAGASVGVTVFTLSISPATATLALLAPEQFTATAQGLTSPTFSWSVDQISGGNASVGTISGTGLYTAPSTPGTHTIAASVVNTSGSAGAAVTVINLTISPALATVDPSTSQQFAATIQGSSQPQFAWSVDGTAGGNTTVGTITTSGLYSAPATLGQHTITATTATTPTVSVNATLTVINAMPGAVLTYHNDDSRDGAYTQEVLLTPANVNQTHFGKLTSFPVDGQIYTQPLYLPNVTIAGTAHEVVYVATQNNSVYAFDATGLQTTPLWTVNLGPSVTKNDYSGVSPVVGILSTPVIDATTNILYLVVETPPNNPTPFRLHALDATTGLDLSGSPVTISGTVPGTGPDNSGGEVSLGTDCYQRMGLALNPVTNAIYIAFGSCNHGWVVSYDKTTLAQKAIFNDTPNGAGGGFWASNGAPAIDDTTGDVYLMSGVDSGDQDYTPLLYNDSFLRLDANTLAVLDYFSPDDNFALAVADADLGSGSNILLPSSSSLPPVTVGGGKDGNIFVVNRENMGGYLPLPGGSNNVIQTVQTGVPLQYDNIFSTPVFWNNTLYYHCNQDVLRAYTWNPGSSTAPITTPPTLGTITYSMHGATASLSANGTAHGIIWDIDNSAYVSLGNGTNPSVLHAYDASNVTTELYNSSQAGTRDTAGYALKFTVPTIANGKVFVPTSNELDIYGLLP